MSTEAEATPTPPVRALERWGVPFHYVVPAAVAVIGWLLLATGGAVAFAGGWWLVVALPIAIGAFLRAPAFAAGPPVVWLVWLIVAAIAGGDSGVAHTPFGIAIALAAIGAVATRVAQFAIFPATARAAWEPAIHRLGSHEDDDTPVDGASEEDGEPTLPELDMTQMTVTFEAIDPIGTAEHDELSAGADELRASAEELDAKEPATGAEAALLDAVAKVEAAATASDAPATEEKAEEPEPTADPGPEPQPKVVHVELPLDADPAPLDEGGHVTEFRAITEADVLAGDQPGSDVP